MPHYFLRYSALGHEACSEINYEENHGFFSSSKYKGTVYCPGQRPREVKFGQPFHLHALALSAYAYAALSILKKFDFSSEIYDSFTEEENLILACCEFSILDVPEDLSYSYFYPDTKKFKLRLTMSRFWRYETVKPILDKYGIKDHFKIEITNDYAVIYNGYDKNPQPLFRFQNHNLLFLRMSGHICRVQPFNINNYL